MTSIYVTLSLIITVFLWELALRIIKYITTRKKTAFSLSQNTMIDSTAEIPDCYMNATWYHDYSKAIAQVYCGDKWEPYSYWRTCKITTPYINVSAKGARLSWYAQSTKENNQLTIYMFGGSTTWGWGARDDYTISSHLAKKIYSDYGILADVVNFGQLGYVNTQEVNLLMRKLTNGNIPDIVIFYDGLNDVFSSYQSGVDGLPQNEVRRAYEWNYRNEKKPILKQILSNSLLYKSLFDVPDKIDLDVDLPSYSLQDPKVKRLFDKVAMRYFYTLRIIGAMSKEFGFDVYCFWQPVLFTKPTLTNYEKKLFETHSFWCDFYHGAYQSIIQFDNKPKFFCDIAHTFKNEKQTIYIDPLHVSEYGNQLVAHEMYSKMKGKLSRGTG